MFSYNFITGLYDDVDDESMSYTMDELITLVGEENVFSTWARRP